MHSVSCLLLRFQSYDFSHFSLYFASKLHTIVIRLHSFHAFPDELRVSAEDVINNISIKGRILPTLTFTWNCKIVDYVTSQAFPISNSFRISIYEASILRRVLSTRYYLAAVFQCSPLDLTTFKAKEFKLTDSTFNPQSSREFPTLRLLSVPPRPRLIPNESYQQSLSHPALFHPVTPCDPLTASAPNLYPPITDQFV